MIKIVEALDKAQIEIARQLFREYQEFLNVDLCFQGFEEELANLPGKYAFPQGSILLAMQDDIVLGCVAVRALKDKVCEMKRLYVLPQGQGKGIGRKLAEAVINKAKVLGYETMQLDTLERLNAAIPEKDT